MRPRLQLALDHTDLPSALAPLQQAAGHIDIVEVGTILCLSEGFGAVRAIKALFPDKPVLADVRIAEAGSLIAGLAIDAGADLVSVVAGASLTTVGSVCTVASQKGAEVQIELGETHDFDRARRWRDLGVGHVIVHRSRDAEAGGELAWSAEDRDAIARYADLGFTVTITGGITAADLATFAGCPVGIVIAGRSIAAAENPARAAQHLQTTLAQTWPS